jgi:hypothetical protein
VFTPFHKPPYTYPYSRSIDETTIAFASHINVPKGNGDVYHKPFKDTCIESDIVVDDCKNML